MRSRKPLSSARLVALGGLCLLGFMLCMGSTPAPEAKTGASLSPVGIVRASSAREQEQKEDSANARGAQDGAQSGMETVTDLLEEQKVTIEFLRTIEDKLDEIQTREVDLERREKDLELLRRDIEEKLDRLKVARDKLKQLTRQVDEDREEELAVAVKKYKAMDPKKAAQFLLQMDLEFVAPVLKKMDTVTAGSIMDAMVDAAQGKKTGIPNKEYLQGLKDLGEYIVDPQRVEDMKQRGLAAP